MHPNEKRVCCADCGIKHLTEKQKQEHAVVTFTIGICDVCANRTLVTSVRHYNYLRSIDKPVQTSITQLLKKVRPRGVTVMDRLKIFAHATKKDIANLTVEERQAVGVVIKDKFFKDKTKKRYVRKILVTEPDGVFKVLTYPVAFCPVIDAIINQYFSKRRGWVKRKTFKVK